MKNFATFQSITAIGSSDTLQRAKHLLLSFQSRYMFFETVSDDSISPGHEAEWHGYTTAAIAIVSAAVVWDILMFGILAEKNLELLGEDDDDEHEMQSRPWTLPQLLATIAFAGFCVAMLMAIEGCSRSYQT